MLIVPIRQVVNLGLRTAWRREGENTAHEQKLREEELVANELALAQLNLLLFKLFFPVLCHYITPGHLRK